MENKQSIVVATAFLIFVAAGVPANGADEPKAGSACWSSAELRGEKVERFEFGPKAYRPSPQGEPLPLTPRMERGVIRRVELPPGRKLIALTFDLCERPDEITGYEGGIVDFLRSEGIKATFFIGGKWTQTHDVRAQQLISDPLFEIANHTWEHRNLRVLLDDEIVDEVKRAQLAYEQVRERLLKKKSPQCTLHDGSALAGRQIPDRLRLFRFPYGACNSRSLDEVAKLGLRAIQWDVSSGDPFFGQSAKMIERDVLTRVRPGSIVLFHANGRGWHTDSALPGIVRGLRANGYKFVTVTELLAAGRPVIVPACYDQRLGDTDQYDLISKRLHRNYQDFRKSNEADFRPTSEEDGGDDLPSPSRLGN